MHKKFGRDENSQRIFLTIKVKAIEEFWMSLRNFYL